MDGKDDNSIKVCDELLEFLEGLPDHELGGNKLSEFYKWQGGDAKDVITSFKVFQHPTGIRSFCKEFSDKLAYRKVDGTLVIMRVADLATKSDATRLSAKLAMAYDVDRSAKDALCVIEEELAALKLELGSMNKLANEVKERGICLRDGSEHGTKLRSALRSQKALTVDKELAKQYKHARKCLVNVF